MSIDLNNGLFIKIEGEIGKFQSLPIDTLVKIAQNLQSLINAIAKSDLSSEEAIDLNNFKIELTGFGKSSAVPQFSFTKRVQLVIGDVEIQRETINDKFSKLLTLSNDLDYPKLKEYYPDSIRRNDIVESLYNFTNSFSNSPTSIVDYKGGNNYVPIYKINRFKPSVKKKLITEIKELDTEKTKEFGYGKVRRLTKKGKVSDKVVEYYTSDEATLSHSPKIINAPGKQYILTAPLRCKLEKEDDYYIIENELLDIIGTGQTIDDAENDFNEEFDFIYQRYNNLSNNLLSDHLQKIKQILRLIIEKVELT